MPITKEKAGEGRTDATERRVGDGPPSRILASKLAHVN